MAEQRRAVAPARGAARSPDRSLDGDRHLEDTDHRAGGLANAGAHAGRLAAIRAATDDADDEAFLLLDGQMTVWVGEQRHILRPGGIAFLPRNIPHAVRCDIASRALVLCTPAGHQEAIFRAAGWDLTKPVPEGWQPQQDAVRHAAEQAGNTVLGPPHGLDD